VLVLNLMALSLRGSLTGKFTSLGIFLVLSVLFGMKN
jgi:hypothetical protein